MTTLAAQRLCKATESSCYVKGTNTFFLQRSAKCNLPFGIDDPQHTSSSSKTNRLDMPELIVDSYNAEVSQHGKRLIKNWNHQTMIWTMIGELVLQEILNLLHCIASKHISKIIPTFIYHCKYLSQTITIPFTHPSISPEVDEADAFAELNQVI